MSVSHKFKNATNHLFSIVSIMIDDNEIVKYVNYDTTDKDVDLLYEYVFPNFPSMNEVPDDSRTRVYINPDASGYYGGNSSLMDDIYRVDIVVPLAHAFTDNGKLRAFGIAYELSKDVDNKNISGIGKADITEYKYYKLADNHVALTFYVKISTQKKSVM